MKRKNYFHFALPRIVAGLLAGAAVFGICFAYLKNAFSWAMEAGFDDRQDVYGRIIQGLAEDKYNSTFVDIFTQFYSADYLRIAEIKEDGSIKTVTETDYNVVPVEGHMDSWYFVTNDESLLAQGQRSTKLQSGEWKIEYKKCDEVWGISNLCDNRIANSWDMLESAGELFYSSRLLQLATYISGGYYYSSPTAWSYYVDGDTLHLGRVSQTSSTLTFDEKLFGKKWDFTDPANADKYIDTEIIEGEEFASTLYILKRAERPDEYLDKLSDVFFADNIESLKSAFKAHHESEGDGYTYAVMGAESEKNFCYAISNYGNYPYTQGCIKVYEFNGRQYLLEYVIATVPFTTFAKPFLIFIAIIILVICLAIALIVSISPYLKYKKAYENNNFKNNLIDSLAHNMKTPLQILGGYAENLKDVKSDEEKDRYADQILEKTSEMNKDIESILKTAEKSDMSRSKVSVRSCLEEVAKKVGEDLTINGDREIRMDKDYFCQAVFCLLDNASKYKTHGTKIDVKIDKNDIVISNMTGAEKYTPGTGIAIAERILEQHKLYLRTAIKGGIFEARIGKKPSGK